MKRLPTDQLCSASGRLEIEAIPGAPKLEGLEVVFNTPPSSINTPSNGYEGISRFHGRISAKVAADGTFKLDGLSPGNYHLSVTAPGCVHFFKSIDLSDKTKDLGDIHLEFVRKMNVQFAVSKNEDFNDVVFQKTTLKANDRWRVNDETPEYAFDLLINQKNGKLVLDYRYAPCHISDLGAAELSDDLDVNMEEFKRRQPQSVPVEEGHVYLIFQTSWKHWILMRTTEVGTIAVEKTN